MFQPIWNLATDTLLGVEALSRPDPGYGLSGPIEAFDIAEQIGRVHQLDVLCAPKALTIAPKLPGSALKLSNTRDSAASTRPFSRAASPPIA